MGQVSEDPAERARHYIENFQQTFASIAYAEGLLDALSFLELIKDKVTR